MFATGVVVATVGSHEVSAASPGLRKTRFCLSHAEFAFPDLQKCLLDRTKCVCAEMKTTDRSQQYYDSEVALLGAERRTKHRRGS